MKKKVLTLICVILIISIAFNIKTYIFSDKEVYVNTDSIKENDEQPEETNTYIYKIDELEKTLQQKGKEITDLKDILQKKEEEMAELKSINKTTDKEDMFSPYLYMADIHIGTLYNALDALKVNEKLCQVLGNLVIPTYVQTGDNICGFTVENVSLYRGEGLENYIEGYIIDFSGEFIITGELKYDEMEYCTFFITSEELANIPFTPHELSYNAINIAMINSEDILRENGYKDGDVVKVKLKNLRLMSIAYKPTANTAEFVEIIKE